MHTTTAPTASSVFNAMSAHPDYLGWGYLNERRSAGRWNTDRVRVADEAALERMAGWTDDERFAWANSKLGRWYGEEAIHGGSVARAVTRYIRKVEG